MNLKRSEFFRQKFYGAMYGLFVCDALGAFNEFKDRATVDENPISDMQAGGPFDLAAGDWTDDSSNALCIADSLIEQGRCELLRAKAAELPASQTVAQMQKQGRVLHSLHRR